MLVIGGVVPDQKHPLSASVVAWQDHFFDKRAVGCMIEVIDLVPIHELPGVRGRPVSNIARNRFRAMV